MRIHEIFWEVLRKVAFPSSHDPICKEISKKLRIQEIRTLHNIRKSIVVFHMLGSLFRRPIQPDTTLPGELFVLGERGGVRYFGEPFKQEPAHKHLIRALAGHRGYQVELRNMRPFGSVAAISNSLTALETWNIQDKDIPAFQPLKERLTQIIWKQILACTTDAQSLVYTSGTNANYQAVRIADHYRDRSGETQRKAVVLSSAAHQLQKQQLGHTSSHTADRSRAVVEVLANHATNYEMSQQQLLAVLRERDDVGVLQLTAGTTNLGIIDELSPEVEAICIAKKIWVHVDAAYGGFNIGLLPDHSSYESSPQVARLRKLLTSPAVSSVVVDPHKFIGPYNLSLLIFPNRADRGLL